MATEINPATARSEGAKANPRRWLKLSLIAAAGVVALAVALTLIARGPGGTAGEVRKLLSGVRDEERQATVNGQFGFSLARIIRDVLNRIRPTSQWRGDYYYRAELANLGTNAVPALLAALESDQSTAVRKVSAMALGDLDSALAVAPLIRALDNDVQSDVRDPAADALAELSDTNALPALLAAMRNDTHQEVRASCIQAVSQLGGHEVVTALIAAAQSETNNTVRAAYASTLGHLQDSRSLPLLVKWLNGDSVSRPTTTLPTPGTFSQIRSDPFDSPEQVVSAAATALGKVGGETAFHALLGRWHGETNIQIQSSLCEAFGDLADARALPILLPLLEESGELKGAAVDALGKLGDTNAVVALIPMLEDSEKDLRSKVAAALGEIGHLAAAPELARRADEDGELEVRASACAALGMMGAPEAQALMLRVLPQLGNYRQNVVWALGHVGDTNAIPLLTELLGDTERETRFAAAYALCEIGGAEAAEALAAHLVDQDEYARHGKASALGLLGRTNSLTELRKGLRAKEPWRRFGAALALIRLGAAVEAAEWAPLLADRSVPLRRLASQSVAGRPMPALIGLLRERDQDYRHYAARGLVFLRDPAALPALREALHDSSAEVRAAARVTLRRIERSETQRE